MLKRSLTLILSVLYIVHTNAQQVTGTVQGPEGELAGATLHWAGTTIGTLAGADGRYSINRVKGYVELVASYAGFIPDTINVTGTSQDFLLVPDINQIEEVTVTAIQRGNYVALGSAVKTEMISFAGLTKMACCNLAESFENSAAVTVGYSDAISGARQIKMLGLTGIYSQLLDENRPVLRGLGSTYGLSYTPGMWLQGIQVSKGTSSVINGHESISGQINLEHRKPTDSEKLFVNGYLDQDLRAELNITSAQQINDKLSTVILTHGSLDSKKTDLNHDGFMDTPTSRQLNLANRWLYMAPGGMQFRWGAKYVNDIRHGGQTDFRDRDRGTTNRYGSRIDNENFNGYVKLALPVGRSIYNDETQEEVRSNVALVADYNYYRQDSYFGLKDYNGTQNSVYANLVYNLNITKRHTVITGISFTTDKYNERLKDSFTNGKDINGQYSVDTRTHIFDRRENETGVFGEYNYSYKDIFNLITGIRGDHSNTYGWFITPRAHFRWTITDGLVLRGSAGKGYRSANLITDNIGMLATGSEIQLANRIKRLEQSVTYGGSLTWMFNLGRDENASLSFDYFRTIFTNQVIADQEYGEGMIYVYNSAGKPTTNTWQGDFNWSPARGLDIFATFRYNDTQIKLRRPGGETRQVQRALVDDFKTLINIQYATRFRKWVFDITAQLNGQSRLPSLNGQLDKFKYSPVYPMFFAQVTRKFRLMDIYIGCENIGDYRQKNPVISAGDPFDRKFNSSVVWGPLMGRKIYGGFRLTLY